MKFSFLLNLQPLQLQLQVMFLGVRQRMDHLLECIHLFVEIEVRKTHCISQLFMCTVACCHMSLILFYLLLFGFTSLKCLQQPIY
jgi:hypothetical protein